MKGPRYWREDDVFDFEFMKTVQFSGHECCVLENESLRLLVTRSIGPRILSLGFLDGENLLADLPDFVTVSPNMGVFHFYGGHRLWHAPEDLNRTYVPDDSPVDIVPIEHGMSVAQETETQTGLQKTLEIQFSDATQVVITHHLSNRGLWDVTCAPWAITQFRPGGTAILPQAQHDTGLLANRALVLWPYTNMSDPNVKWGNGYILIDANMEGPFKIGFSNPRGWLAYWLNETLFVKHAQYDVHASYYDYGSSSECYCNDRFLELETLAPVGTIAPGSAVTHVETWDLYKDIKRPHNEKEVQALAEKLGLDL
jgi:hypothetical protein